RLEPLYGEGLRQRDLLEGDLRADLQAALIVRRGRARGNRRASALDDLRRDRRGRVAERIGRDHAVHRGDAEVVEDVLTLTEDLEAALAEVDEADIARIDVEHAAEAAGVASDTERAIVRGVAIVVQVAVRADVERETAVRLDDDAELVV